MTTRVFTSAIVLHKTKFLILRRTGHADFGKNLWDVVGGHFEGRETAEKNILREAREETGLKVRIAKAGKSYEVRYKKERWVVIPFLLQAPHNRVKIKPDEHSECKWIFPREAKNYDCVPDIKRDLKLFRLI